nr:MAG: capsid protein [Crogonang virus 106]
MQRKNLPNKNARGRRGSSTRPRNANPRPSPTSYAPVAMSTNTTSTRMPRVSSTSLCTRISHTEYFGNCVSAGTAFAVQTYACNPGVAALFPWLSQVAQRYETYKFRSLRFEYCTRAATTQVGSVGMAFDFDGSDLAPSSQKDALSYHDAVASSPWKDFSLSPDLVQGDRLPTRYTRVGLPSGAYDIKTFDLGALHVFTDGVAASANLGMMEVRYTIDLYTPQIQDPIGGVFTATTGLTAANLWGTNLTAGARAISPFVQTSASLVTFVQSFSGLIGVFLQGTNLNGDIVPTLTGTGQASRLIYYPTTASLNTVGYIRVRADPGDTLSLAITSATAVTQAQYQIASGSYASFA